MRNPLKTFAAWLTDISDGTIGGFGPSGPPRGAWLVRERPCPFGPVQVWRFRDAPVHLRDFLPPRSFASYEWLALVPPHFTRNL